MFKRFRNIRPGTLCAHVAVTLAYPAFKALTAALKNSDNEVLKANHVHLMNDRPAHFTNSGLGDQWYSLMLEEPKIKTQRQRSVYR